MNLEPDDELLPRPQGQGLPAPPLQYADGPWRALASLVVRDGVGLGGLPQSQRSLALAWVWAGLPADAAVDERRVNDLLKAQLAGPAAFLDIDHVELRRWLVDAGWLARDSWGREYRRIEPAALGAAQRMLARQLDGVDTRAWVADARAAQRARRDAKRQAWQAGQNAKP